MNKEYLEGMKTAIEDCEKNGFDWVVSITVNTNYSSLECEYDKGYFETVELMAKHNKEIENPLKSR